jgi:cytochrome oxidase Cu insertion factor (SCO1/SenC/PrrC family)
MQPLILSLIRVVALTFVVTTASAAPDSGHDVSAARPASAVLPASRSILPLDVPGGLSIQLPDVTVIDQQGRTLQWLGDLTRGRSVAIQFVHGSCGASCEPLFAAFKGMQDELARQGRSDMQLISVFVDPPNDTADLLARQAARLGAGPAWSLVTGSRASVDAITGAFRLPAAKDGPQHSPLVFLGHEPSRRWARAAGHTDPGALIRRLAALTPSSTQAQRPGFAPVAGRAAAASASTY